MLILEGVFVMITLYSLSTWPWCKKAKQLLAEKNVDYDCVEVDQISGDEQKNAVEEVKRLTGRTSFPVIVIKDKVIQGYKLEEIEEALSGEE